MIFDFFFRSLSENGKYINQFPAENNVTCKDLLARAAQRAVGVSANTDTQYLHRGPDWIPTTFNLTMELPQFVQHYLKRKER